MFSEIIEVESKTPFSCIIFTLVHTRTILSMLAASLRSIFSPLNHRTNCLQLLSRSLYGWDLSLRKVFKCRSGLSLTIKAPLLALGLAVTLSLLVLSLCKFYVFVYHFCCTWLLFLHHGTPPPNNTTTELISNANILGFIN